MYLNASGATEVLVYVHNVNQVCPFILRLITTST